ncbi:UDP-4-amino-4,6-dideoxy-N-acetyl-beta-L-altrosamine N-acetyltransferase [Seongchinamella sediminis]|uniref:UDP-4-amino-4, 6-dideoxy-N-acetyl-beta-L-altrosamine N-acetyltransferase n=2 Tax=Seongchinamella sediminis TaxID=2283635 RepID=A0A3L7E1Z4_9GAMM|nr:UDP-4-amino-4,6-dideoxy-N-acetyl-beta-L-altrosamine N-acetyltransferase [Seongchinamella sediminis]
MEANDLELVWRWRNSDRVRSFMFSQRIISFEEHLAWFERSSNDPRKHLLIYVEREQPLGFVHFSEISDGGIVEWSFHTAPDARKGVGSKMGEVAIGFAFERAGFHKVCGQVISYNQRSLDYHIRLGFKKEGILFEQFYDGKIYHDVVCFGLLQSGWISRS